jgi:hypothetical protein
MNVTALISANILTQTVIWQLFGWIALPTGAQLTVSVVHPHRASMAIPVKPDNWPA